MPRIAGFNIANVTIHKDASDVPTGAVTFEFPNAGKVEVAISKLNEEMATRMAVHGMVQKLRDSFAGVTKENGQSQAAITEAYNLVKDLWSRIVDGEWYAEREGGLRDLGTLAQALTNLATKAGKATFKNGKPVSLENAREIVEALAPAAIKSLRENPEVFLEMSRIKAERLTKSETLDF